MADPMFDKFGVNFNPNQIIFCEHEPGNDFYMIQKGNVRVTKVVDSREKTLDEFRAGDVFGEMSILEEAPRTATAIALTEVTALRFTKENFDELLKGNPVIAFKLLKTFSKRIYDAKRRLMILVLDNDEDKVIDTLCMLAEQKGALPDTRNSIEIDATEESVAKWCSVDLDLTKKVIRSFQKSGKIVIGGHKMSLKNYNELYRLINSKRKILMNINS